MLPNVQPPPPPSRRRIRRWPLLTLCAVAALCLAVLLGALLSTRGAEALPAQRTVWAIAQVDRELFSGFPPPGASCFALHAGRSRAQVFVVDPSYTDYWDVGCETSAVRSGRDYLLTIDESWQEALPQGWGPVGWVRRLLYHPPTHTWTYRVYADGKVVALPERGKPAPQSYSH